MKVSLSMQKGDVAMAMLKWFSLICYIMGSYFQLFMRLLGVDVPLLSLCCLIVVLWITMDLFNKDKEMY